MKCWGWKEAISKISIELNNMLNADVDDDDVITCYLY
jgi:hypothetical protein